MRLSGTSFFVPNGGDMKFYSDWGLKVAHGAWTDHQAFYGLPGYPFFLGLLYRILNFDRFWVSLVAGLIQALADGFTAVLIWKIAIEAFPGEEEGAPGRAIGWMAGIGWALYQPAQAFSAVLMPTAQAVAVFWYCVWVLMRRRKEAFSIWTPWLPLGALIGFEATIVATILFIVPLAVAAILRNSKFAATSEARSGRQIRNSKGEMDRQDLQDAQDEKRAAAPKIKFHPVNPVHPVQTLLPTRALRAKFFGFRFSNFEFRPATAVVLLIAGILAGASPCWVHNYFVAREPVMLSAHSGLNFYIGNNPLATGYPKMPPGMSAGQQGMLKDSIGIAEKAEGRPLKHYEVSQYWAAKAHDYIRSHPGAWLRLMGRKFANFWNSFQYDDLSLITFFNRAGLLAPGPRFGWVAALAIPGMILALARRRRAGWGRSIGCDRSIGWVVAAVLLHMGALMPVFVTERYRLAAVPGLLLLGAYGLWEFWGWLYRARWIPAIAYACAGLLAAFWVATPPADASLWSLDYYNTGIKALDQRDYGSARRDLETAYRYVPDNSEVNFALGLLWQNQGDLRRAETFYAKALAINPQHVGAWNNLGVLAAKHNAWTIAQRFFDKAIEIDPSDAKTYYLQARVYATLGQWQNARTDIETALRLRPGEERFEILSDRIRTRGPIPEE